VDRRTSMEVAALASAAVTVSAGPARAEEMEEPATPLNVRMDNPEFKVRVLEFHSCRM
jgi:hypothetical protein